MAFPQPLTAILTPHPTPVAPLAELSRREGSTDAYNYAKINIPTAMRRHAGAWQTLCRINFTKNTICPNTSFPSSPTPAKPKRSSKLALIGAQVPLLTNGGGCPQGGVRLLFVS